MFDSFLFAWCRHCMHQGEAAREEDCRKESEEERQVPETHVDNITMFGEQRKSDESCAHDGGFESRRENGYVEDWWRGFVKVGSTTCGHHSEVGHGAGADEFDRVVEHVESDEKWIGDDHRKQSRRQLELQRDRPERGRYAAQMKNSGK